MNVGKLVRAVYDRIADRSIRMVTAAMRPLFRGPGKREQQARYTKLAEGLMAPQADPGGVRGEVWALLSGAPVGPGLSSTNAAEREIQRRLALEKGTGIPVETR